MSSEFESLALKKRMSEEATVEDQLMSTEAPPQTSENESGNDEKEESEEEYEIEAILDAKRGMFGVSALVAFYALCG